MFVEIQGVGFANKGSELMLASMEFPRWLVFLRGGEGDFLVSFAAALGVSVVLAVVWSALASRQRLAPRYDYRRLDEQVQLIQG